MTVNRSSYDELGEMEKFLLKKMDKTIMGGKITGFLFDPESGCVGITVENKNKIYHCWILRDEEGNGPGWLDIDGEDKK